MVILRYHGIENMGRKAMVRKGWRILAPKELEELQRKSRSQAEANRMKSNIS